MPAAIPEGAWGPGYVRVLTGAGANDYVDFEGSGSTDATFGCFGYSVSGQIDIAPYPGPLVPLPSFGDGNDDILVGEPLFDFDLGDGTFLDAAGKAHVFSVLDGASLVAIRGRAAGWQMGWEVQGLGNFDGAAPTPDSWATTASRYGAMPSQGACALPCVNSTTDPGDTLCGRIYLFQGSGGVVCSTITGENFRDSCGWSIARTGNLGGTSLPDFVFSSPRWGEAVAGTIPPLLDEFGKVYIRHR